MCIYTYTNIHTHTMPTKAIPACNLQVFSRAFLPNVFIVSALSRPLSCICESIESSELHAHSISNGFRNRTISIFYTALGEVFDGNEDIYIAPYMSVLYGALLSR